MLAKSLRNTGRSNKPAPAGPLHLHPKTLSDLRKCLEPTSRTPLPIRPVGAGTAATDCNTTAVGSILHMAGLDRIRRIDADNGIVVVEAGIRVATLVDTLAEDGLELCGGYELQGRTVGGAIAAPCCATRQTRAGCPASSSVPDRLSAHGLSLPAYTSLWVSTHGKSRSLYTSIERCHIYCAHCV